MLLEHKYQAWPRGAADLDAMQAWEGSYTTRRAPHPRNRSHGQAHHHVALVKAEKNHHQSHQRHIQPHLVGKEEIDEVCADRVNCMQVQNGREFPSC